jgi:hypothetical protein
MYHNELLNGYVITIAIGAGLAVILGLARYFLDMRDSVRIPARMRSQRPNPWDGPPRGYGE